MAVRIGRAADPSPWVNDRSTSTSKSRSKAFMRGTSQALTRSLLATGIQYP